MAKAFEARNFFMMGFHLGFSGSVDIDATTAPLDSTIGFNLRGDVPLERYLLLGPLVQFGAWRPDGSPPSNWNYYIDADLYIRGRIPISTDSTKFQLWAGVPIGFTVDLLGQEASASGFGIGWNVGVLTGGAVHFTPNFGMFAELGWMQHRISHAGQIGEDLDFRLAQGNFNVGIVLKD